MISKSPKIRLLVKRLPYNNRKSRSAWRRLRKYLVSDIYDAGIEIHIEAVIPRDPLV